MNDMILDEMVTNKQTTCVESLAVLGSWCSSKGRLVGTDKFLFFMSFQFLLVVVVRLVCFQTGFVLVPAAAPC